MHAEAEREDTRRVARTKKHSLIFSNRGLSHTAKESNAQTHKRTNAPPKWNQSALPFLFLSPSVIGCFKLWGGRSGVSCDGVRVRMEGGETFVSVSERSRSSLMSRPAVIYIHLCTIFAFCTCVCDTPSTALHPVCTSSQTRTPPHCLPPPPGRLWEMVARDTQPG